MPMLAIDSPKRKYTIDLEWDIKTKAFRCASMTSGKTVTVYDSLSEFTKALAKLPKDTIIGGHYVISDLGQIVRWGQGPAIPSSLKLEDTVIAARLLFRHAPTKDLKTLSAEFGWRYESLQKEQTGVVAEEDLEYCAKDSWASHHLWSLLTENATADQVKSLALNNELQKAFFALELAGIKFDVAKAELEDRRLTDVLNGCIHDLPVGLTPAVAKDDNELREWLKQNYSAEELKFFEKTKTTGELSVGVKYLKMLKRKVEGFDALLEARDVQTFLSLYVQGKQRFLDDRQFLYPSYGVLTLTTHRRNTRPSVQNWPKAAREFIVSRWKEGSIVWGDFKQLEARLFAWQCGSKQMMEDLITGGYIGIASRVYGLDVEKGSDKYKLVKATVLATQYNMGAGKLRHKIHLDHGFLVTFKESQAMLDKFFNTYPEISTEADRRCKIAWQTGFTWSDAMAPMPLYLLPASHYPPEDEWDLGYGGTPIKPWSVKQVENCAINWPTQQLAGYVTGSALLSMQEALAEKCGGWGAYFSQVYDSTKLDSSKLTHIPMVEVHDELVCDSQSPEETKEFMKYHMTEGMKKYLLTVCPYFDCPVDVDLESMKYWSKT